LSFVFGGLDVKWHFSRQLADQVETEITQRDQFDNDQVNISETIVREAIQNSLDAAASDSTTVEVRFRLHGNLHSTGGRLLRDVLETQLEHAKVAGIELDGLNFNEPSALVIEDFGTKGLTGSISEKDTGNFSDFWRRHGKSHKFGRSRGRWGLGKLVYSSTSMVGAFFGVTRRIGEDSDYLMGQTVLNLRTINGVTYPPHGYFCDLENEDDPYTRIPVPVGNSSFVSAFIDAFELDRRDGAGLSIVIPYPSPSVSLEGMIGISIANYFYPVITKKLVMRFNDLVVDHGNVRQLAHVYASNHFQQIDTLFDFIEEASQRRDEVLWPMRASWTDDKLLTEDDFEPEYLEEIRSRFVQGELVGLNLPITLSKKDGTSVCTSFSVFIKRPQELKKGLDLYVRGGLTLPAETKFKERRALAVLVAEEEPICDFLGDAENAAHTLWTTNTEKLRKNYRNTQSTVTMIKKSLVQLYDLLADVTEELDEDALTQFFWYQEPERKGGKKRKKQPGPIVPPALPQEPPRFNVSRSSSGFTLSQGQGLAAIPLPLAVRIKVAYDVSKGDAFSKWSHHDFDVKAGKGITCELSGGVKLVAAEGQEWELEIASVDFDFVVSGFDGNRDLKVRII
jgi:hypothetical protein